MLEPSANLPAHLALLLNEPFPFDDVRKARKKLRSMIRELKDQAFLPSIEHAEGAPQKAGFRVTMNGGLDLFRGEGACTALACRISYADQIARSIALMADQVSMHDFLMDRIVEPGKKTDTDLDLFLSDIIVLKRLKPLIEAKLLTFEPTIFAACSSCIRNLEEKITEISDRMLEAFRGDLSVGRYENGTAYVDAGALYEPHLYIHWLKSASSASDDELLSYVIQQCVRAALLDMYAAGNSGGTVFSNSPIGMASIMEGECRFESKISFRALDAQRAGSLPWVRGLTIEQTLQLREEASTALPRLREFLANNLGARSVEDRTGTTEADYVAQLREQAEEVKSELALATTKRSSFMQNALGLASLGVCAFGLSADLLTKTEGVIQLLGTLGMLHGISSPHGQQLQQLRARPGYVLVAAEEILEHASPM